MYDVIIPSFSKLIFVFFMVSAFAMCCGYYEKFKNGEITPNKFYSRRFDRILPFFSIVVVLDIIISTVMTTHLFSDWSRKNEILESLMEGFTDLTLSYGLLPNPRISVVGVGWFLGVIFLFYYMFPFFVFMIDNKKRAWLSLAICSILTIICLGYFFTDKFIGFPTTHQSIIYDSTFFLVGGLIYLYRHQLEILGKSRFLVLVLGIFATYLFWTLPANKYSTVFLLNLICASFIIYAISGNHPVLDNKVMHFLSNIGLEIYLTHMMCFRFVELLSLQNLFQNPEIYYWAVAVLTVLSSIVLSLGINHLINLFYKKK